MAEGLPIDVRRDDNAPIVVEGFALRIDWTRTRDGIVRILINPCDKLGNTVEGVLVAREDRGLGHHFLTRGRPPDHTDRPKA